jgi:hypothetical protein
VERLEHPGLGVRTQVDQQVPARHHVQPGERRIGQHVLDREDDAGAQVRSGAPSCLLANEEPGPARRRDAALYACGIGAVPRGGDRLGIHVGREDPQLDRAASGFDLLQEEHGERVGLFARVAAGNPDAQRLAGWVGRDQLRDGVGCQGVEHGRVRRPILRCRVPSL